MRKLFAPLFAFAALLCASAPALAQSTASLANGSRAPFTAPVQCSTLGSSCTTGASLARVSGVASGYAVKATPGLLYSLNVVAGASAGYVLVTDATFIQGDGAIVPSLCMPVAANAGVLMDFGTPINFDAGIVVHFSTTGCYIKTGSATAFIAASYK